MIKKKNKINAKKVIKELFIKSDQKAKKVKFKANSHYYL